MSEDSRVNEGGGGAAGGDNALCDQPELMTFSVVPDIGNRLPPDGALHGACRDALSPHAMPRPGPESPMLRELARLHAELTR